MALALVGVLGGGQLGRMLGLAGIPLGLRFRFYEPGDASPVAALGEVVSRPWTDAAALAGFAAGLDVCTFEVESVPVEAAAAVAAAAPIRPPVTALAAGRDRFAEKELFDRLGIPTSPWRPVTGADSATAAVRALGLPLVLKARTLGYDGRGVAIVRERSELEPARVRLGGEAIAEAFLPFDREVSALVVRAESGELAAYPVVENVHREGQLRLTAAPAPGLEPAAATRAAARVAAELGHVGVLTLELFEVAGEVLANEIAPRVHNSGHWTIDAAETSQFENHLRAILGLPLGSTAQTALAAMVNLIGTVPPAAALLGPGVHLHDYGKAPRPNRKVGHVTVTAPDAATLAERLARVRGLVPE